eukprot:jgi/Psemu1/47078/gm1.47078_g
MLPPYWYNGLHPKSSNSNSNPGSNSNREDGGDDDDDDKFGNKWDDAFRAEDPGEWDDPENPHPAPKRSNSLEDERNLLQLIQGPPGTGKTTFVVSVLARLLCMPKRRRILVTAPTNKAVGFLAKRFLESCPGLLEDHRIPLALIGVEDKLLEAESGTGGIFRGSGGSGSKGSKEEHSSSHPSCSFADAQLKRIFCYTWIGSLAEEYDQLLAQLEKESLSLPKPEQCLPSSSAANRGVAAWLPRMLMPPSSRSRDYSFVVHSDSDSNTEDKGDDGSSSTAELERGKAPPDNHAAVHTDTDTLWLLDKAPGLHVRLVKNLPRLSESSSAADLSRKLIRCLAGRGSGSEQAPCIILRELLTILRDEHSDTGGFGGSNDDGDDYEGEAERGNLRAEAVPELLATARIVFCTLSTAGTGCREWGSMGVTSVSDQNSKTGLVACSFRFRRKLTRYRRLPSKDADGFERPTKPIALDTPIAISPSKDRITSSPDLIFHVYTPRDTIFYSNDSCLTPFRLHNNVNCVHKAKQLNDKQRRQRRNAKEDENATKRKRIRCFTTLSCTVTDPLKPHQS